MAVINLHIIHKKKKMNVLNVVHLHLGSPSCSVFYCNTFQMSIQVIRIGRERFTVGEALFQPSILGLEAHGIVEQLVRSISTVSSENQKQLLENTVLCGGTTSMTGKNHIF